MKRKTASRLWPVLALSLHWASSAADGQTAADQATPQDRRDVSAGSRAGAPGVSNPTEVGLPATAPPGGSPLAQPGPSGVGATSPGLSGVVPNGAADGLPRALSSGLGGGLSGGGSYFGMLGDQSPIVGIRQGPTLPPIPQPIPPNGAPSPPSPRLASSLAPSVRGIKIAVNQSPRPQDRVFYSFNYYSNVNGALNSRLDTPVSNLRVYRHIMGFEKTFFDGVKKFFTRTVE